ncbi:hypothetical protein Esti_005814 [Eimeria stiedai]
MDAWKKSSNIAPWELLGGPSQKMKLFLPSSSTRGFWMSACLGAFAVVMPTSAETDGAAFLTAGREVPVNTSAREIRPQPVMQIVQAEFYTPPSEPGAIRPSSSGGDDPSSFPNAASYLDSPDSALVYSRMSKPTPLPILSLLDMFTSRWDEAEAEEDGFIEEEESESASWIDDVLLQSRSQPKLRLGRRFLPAKLRLPLLSLFHQEDDWGPHGKFSTSSSNDENNKGACVRGLRSLVAYTR